MRVVGTLLILLACAAVQLPWFTCHSDCRDACLPVWDLGAHHCHDETAEDHHAHHCLAHCGVQHAQDRHAQDRHAQDRHAQDRHAGDRQAEEQGDGNEREKGHGDDHGPGDHQLQFQISRRPVPPTTLSPIATVLAVALVAPVEIRVTTPVSCDLATTGAFDTGPPSRLATVRLLL